MGKPKTALRYHVGAKQELALGLLEYQTRVWDDLRVGVEAEELTGLRGLLTFMARVAEDCQRQPSAGGAVSYAAV